jgi:hypothetical protein
MMSGATGQRLRQGGLRWATTGAGLLPGGPREAAQGAEREKIGEHKRASAAGLKTKLG